MLKRIELIFITACILLCELGLSHANAAQVAASRTNNVAISFSAPSISAMVLEIASQKGFYKEEGVDVALVRGKKHKGQAWIQILLKNP